MKRAMIPIARTSLAVLLVALPAACAHTPSSGFDNAADAGQANAAHDAGDEPAPASFYATFDGDTAPTDMLSPTALSYAAGYTVISGQAILARKPGDALPTIADVAIRVPSMRGTFICSDGTTQVELDESPDSNANLTKRGSTATGGGDCTIEVTTFGARIAGTVSASVYATGKLSDGMFDLPLAAHE